LSPARLGLIGDVHGEADRLAAVLDHLHARDVDAILCTGDVPDGPGCINRCCALLEDAGVLCVAGNHERWLLTDRVRHVPDAHVAEQLDDRSRAFLQALPPTREVDTAAGPLLLCHGIGEEDHRKVWPGSERLGPERSRTLDAIIAEDRVRWLVNGHLHYRMILDFAGLTLVNAGTLNARHRPPGFIELDLAAGEAIFLGLDDDAGVREQVRHPLVDHDRRVFTDTRDFDGDWTVFPAPA
jgi:predicted phosphodiesterase